MSVGKTLIVVGAALVVTGVLWPYLARLGLGRLPGDIAIDREGFSFRFPVTTMIVVSLAATLVLNLLARFMKW